MPRKLIDAARRLKRRVLKPRRITRFAARNEAEAAPLLAQLSAEAGKNGTVLVVGEGAFANAVVTALRSKKVPQREVTSAAFDPAQVDGIACIAIASTDSRVHLAVARACTRHPAAAEIPLEYVALPHVENAPLAGWDRYQNGDFISPMLGQTGTQFYEIFGESLKRFEHKTEIRDYLDLAQLLQSVVARGIAGPVAEFGSFKGHSGWLTSRTLEALGSDKTLYMFDMFENFPEENVGVDRFWSGTHQVDFASVKAKFADRRNVQMVKGDFTRTFAETSTGALSLAFIDCDSYRATKYLLDEIWHRRLSPGGVLVLEDYGHGALLGNRVAVHEFFDGRRDAFTYFSQFSGFFVAVKPG